jgi:glycosyltransferase involved in cell wall biosynthesis
MAGERLSEDEEHDFFANMVHSPELMAHIAAHPELGPFFFIPYLFTTAVWGPLIHPRRSVLIPCLHDEGYARMQSVRRAFESARAIAFHVPAERDLGASLYDLSRGEPLVLGEGIDTDWSADGERFRAKYGVQGPFILYAGRKDAGKNTPLLVQYFLRYVDERAGAGGLKLLLIGNLPAPVPAGREDVAVDLGFVSRQDKYDAYAAAQVFVQPSLMESFSIVIMEAWLAGTPVMVHTGCAVTREHVERSGGGLHFHDYPHFAESLDLILSRPALAKQMAEAGRAYVLDNFAWPQVTARFVSLIARISSEPDETDAPTASAAPALLKAKTPQGPAVHQMLADFAFGDAIGNDVLAIQKALHSWGLASEIFAVNSHGKVRSLARPAADYARLARPEDVLIFHFSIGHALADEVVKLPGRKVLRYHNITPPHFLEQVYPASAERCRLGREQLKRMASAFTLALGVSAYNCEELIESGYGAVEEVPILLDLDLLSTPPDPLVSARFGDGRPTVLHVGRLVPNKRIEDLIKAHYWLARLIPGARLLIVGGGETNAYALGLRDLALALDVPGVHFGGHVSNAALTAYYRAASLYLCLSEHEGFCVPLVEAMHFGLPIVAFAAAGVTGTLGQGGVLLQRKDPLLTAELMARVLTDPALGQEAFRPPVVQARLQEVLRTRLGLEVGA